MKKIVKALCLAGVIATLSLVALKPTPVYALEGESTEEETTYIRTVPDAWANQMVEYGGLNYSVSSTKYLSANISTNPEEVKELILYYQFGKSKVSYTTIDWSKYTALTDVVVVANSMYDFKDILSALPSGINLYLGSEALDFGTALTTMPFENIYICSVYRGGGGNINSSSFTENLASSKLKNIYYNDMAAQNESYYTTFNNANHTNKDGVQITASKMTTAVKYPEYVFYPFEKFTKESSLFASTSYFYANTTGQITSMSAFNEYILETDKKVCDLNIKTIGCGNDLDHTISYGKLYFQNNTSYNFSSCHAEEVILKPVRNMTFNVTYFHNIKAIRFQRTTVNLTLDSATLSSTSSLQKIYIPSEYASYYQVLYERDDLKDLIETYDLSTYTTPANSYKIEDNTLVYVKNDKFTIEQIEAQRLLLNQLGIDYEGRAVDEVTSNYEFPLLKEGEYENNYKIRPIDTIIVPKNIHAKDVLLTFQDLLLTNNGWICDPEGFKIANVDTTNYTKGYNGILSFSYQMPDGSASFSSVNVRTMPIEGDIAYIMDGSNINVVCHYTKENVPLVQLLEPIMDNFLMETAVVYETSNILDTTTSSFNCGNHYQATASRGKVRVLTIDTPLVETQNPNEDETTNPPANEDTNDIDTEGYQMLEIDKIYTPTTIDGSKLITGLRNDLCTLDGKPYEVNFSVAYNTHDNTKPWSFTLMGSITETDKYQKNVNVEIIQTPIHMGFIVFKDGTIACEYNHFENYTEAQIKESIEQFLESQKLDKTTLKMPDSIKGTNVFYGSYEKGKIIILNSGYNLAFTTNTKPTDQTALKTGYHGFSTIYYTNDFKVEEALRIVSRSFLLKDGILVSDYDIEFTTKEDSSYVSYTCKNKDTILLKGTLQMKKIESDYSYVFGLIHDFDYGYLALKQQSKAPIYQLNDVMIDVLERFRGLMSTFNNPTTIDFTKLGKADVDGVYQVGNGAYYSYEYDVEVIDLNHTLKTNKCIINGLAEEKEKPSDKVEDIFEDIKTKFEENKAFKAVSIILGILLGFGLIYLAYRLIRNMMKWLKKH